MTKKEILMAMLEAVLDAEERTGGHIWFEYSPHVNTVRVCTYTQKWFDAKAEVEDLVYLLEGAEPTEEALDALRWRLLPENLRKVWSKA